jgi:hypothetical protein
VAEVKKADLNLLNPTKADGDSSKQITTWSAPELERRTLSLNQEDFSRR